MSIRAARARIIAGAVVLAALPALSGTPAAAHSSGVRLDFLGERELPNAMTFQGTTVGGLSAITYDVKSGTYYVISDDRSQTGPARFYTARLDLTGDALKSVELTGTHPWLRPDGSAFPPTSTATVAPDPEGIAVDPRDGSLAWTSEGERIVPSDGPALLGDPWIRRATTTGTYAGQLPLPPQLHMNSQEFGPRKNQTLEGVTFTPDGRRIVTAMEDPLHQDGDDPTPEHGALTRITVHDARTGQPLSQYAYPLEPLFAATPAGSTDTNGVSDLVALGHDRFLVLERASIFTDNNWKARIYLVDLHGATDVLGRDSLTDASVRPVKPVRKTLVTDLSDVPGLSRVDNVEGITLGPRLPDGRRAVVLVSDDNFAARQVTQFVAFALG
ncbi:esterase-like activity of phytase family protein [Streptomyces stelliscabiei]|uniref:3-phytase n=3 Tax=Streptomyces stelliscabiei TaxID=146820 RepID=A0A8I0PBU7_9ACTN|nr:esterase-like activity of phytase family protein [Streptomyces stelliscabiei]KND42753.1 3-phytase [Streptomyces stelliscabiei]MBE1601990.1 3-phytase [Streptomyces stelliscabiei]MDX2514207.1 esterase-like activity of phytase family protein [Streptomyces stelliscabiei]MDX2552529.1 esterase-like activity of phytase family protein [Streptomyces stelliscabiei]MDX2611924.1 esterase-like activity of phytase family protein [Streptomyces stelliscabiei]